ncbi:MAG: hypothetical protein EXQ96_09230 [Alphaproteobacteria bacterium]|nr:hypothetical protein [Alphaproteobacteria bacterium]
MAVFAIIRQPHPDPTALPKSIEQHFPETFLKLSDDAWLVAGDMAARELSDKLEVTAGSRGSAVIVKVEDYYG